MAENTYPQPDIESARDLLSPYLDNEVTDDERALVEQALAASPNLRLELELLRQTVSLVSALPRVPAPRPFTLSEVDVKTAPSKPKRSWALPAWFGGMAAAAAALVCVLAVGGLFWRTQLGSGGADQVALAPQLSINETAMEEAPAEAPEQPAAVEIPAEEEAIEEPAAEEPAAKEAPAEGAAPAAVESEDIAEPVEVEKEAERDRDLMDQTAPPPTPTAAVTLYLEAPAEAQEEKAEAAMGAAGEPDSQTESGMAPAMTATPLPLSTFSPTPLPTASPLPNSTAMARAVPGSDVADEVGGEAETEEKTDSPAPPESTTEAIPQDDGVIEGGILATDATAAVPTSTTAPTPVGPGPDRMDWSMALILRVGLLAIGALVMVGLVIWLVRRRS